MHGTVEPNVGEVLQRYERRDNITENQNEKLKRTTSKIHRNYDCHPPSHLRDLFKQTGMKPGDRVKWSGKVGKNGNVLLSIEKVE